MKILSTKLLFASILFSIAILFASCKKEVTKHQTTDYYRTTGADFWHKEWVDFEIPSVNVDNYKFEKVNYVTLYLEEPYNEVVNLIENTDYIVNGATVKIKGDDAVDCDIYVTINYTYSYTVKE